MRKHSMRALALTGALALGLTLTACGAEPGAEGESKTASEAATEVAASEDASAEASEEAAPETKDPESTAVASIEEMPKRLVKKNYACRDWKQTDDIEGADASGTCNGEDQVMWFADETAVEAKIAELDDQGVGYVHGDNWIVANTKTPTLVRNAFGGEAVKAKK